jgi:hypothetical protein
MRHDRGSNADSTDGSRRASSDPAGLCEGVMRHRRENKDCRQDSHGVTRHDPLVTCSGPRYAK